MLNLDTQVEKSTISTLPRIEIDGVRYGLVSGNGYFDRIVDDQDGNQHRVRRLSITDAVLSSDAVKRLELKKDV